MFFLLIAFLGIVITLIFVIGTHEAAHFFAARILGIKILRFSIGFGKALFTWRDHKGTEYSLGWIPLGGYVKMLDSRFDPITNQKETSLAFNEQPFYKKFLIIAAGPFVNIFSAFVLYWIIFIIGFITIKPVIGHVEPHSIAAKAGLTAQQEIIEVDNEPTLTWTKALFLMLIHIGEKNVIDIKTENITSKKITNHILLINNWRLDNLTPDPLKSLGIMPFAASIPPIISVKNLPTPHVLKEYDEIIKVENIPISNWETLAKLIYQSPDQILNFTLKRNNKTYTYPVTIGHKYSFFHKIGYLGITPSFQLPKQLLRQIKYSPIDAVVPAYKEILDFCYFNLVVFKKMITGKLSLQSLGGPITIFENAGNAINSGLLAFFAFLAFLSISVGIINLLPIPGLDGGHLAIYFFEFIFNCQLSNKVIFNIYRIGFLILFFFLFQALLNDILRLYS